MLTDCLPAVVGVVASVALQNNAKVCVVGGAGGIGQPMSMLLKSKSCVVRCHAPCVWLTWYQSLSSVAACMIGQRSAVSDAVATRPLRSFPGSGVVLV